MLIYLYGPEEFLIRRKLKELVNEYRKKYPTGLNIFRFNDENFTQEKLDDILKNNSLFEEKKLVVLEKVNNQKIKFETDIIWVVWHEKPSKEILKTADLSQEFPKLARTKLVNWIKREAKIQGAETHPKAIYQLIELYQNNLWQLAGEIQKLAAYNHLAARPPSGLEVNIFEAIDRLAEKDKKAAVGAFQKLRAQGKGEIYLFSMIVYQWRNLLKVKSSKRPQSLKIHPYVLQKTKRQAEKFSLEELKRSYQLLADLDFRIKTGQKDARFALDYFVLKI